MALFTLKWPQVVLLTLPVNPVKVPFSGNAGDLFMILHHHGRGWGKDIYLSTFNAQTCSLAFALFVSLGVLLNVFNASSCTISDCYYFFFSTYMLYDSITSRMSVRLCYKLRGPSTCATLKTVFWFQKKACFDENSPPTLDAWWVGYGSHLMGQLQPGSLQRKGACQAHSSWLWSRHKASSPPPLFPGSWNRRLEASGKLWSLAVLVCH